MHGHFTVFFWGQHYGGSAEEVLLAPFVAVFGMSRMTIGGVQILFSVGATVLTWRIARRLVGDSWLAALAGVIVWLAPQVAISNTTYSFGFRGVTILSGLVMILLALRVLDGESRPLKLFPRSER